MIEYQKKSMNTNNSSIGVQSQDNLEKYFFAQLQPGDFIDAKYTEKEWKLAKVIDKEHKYLTIMFDGYHSTTQQIYMHSVKVAPIRYCTIGYTGPQKPYHASIKSIPDLEKYIKMLDTMISSEQAPSPYKITQYLRGELFTAVNSLLMSDIEFDANQVAIIFKFLLKFLEKVAKICTLVKEYSPDYFESQPNNKLIYLANYRLALVFSLQQLLFLVNSIISNDTPKLLKIYKAGIPQEQLISHLKQSIKIFVELFQLNDGNGRWMPSDLRIQIMKILIRYRREQQALSVKYDLKDFAEFHYFWGWVLKNCPSIQNEDTFLTFILKSLLSPAPFDAKLRALQILRKLIDRQFKLPNTSSTKIVQLLQKKQLLDHLLSFNNFNHEILKRYIPILQQISQNYNQRKYVTNNHIQTLFGLMKNRHESQVNSLQEIIINIADFVSIDLLDVIFQRVEASIDLNSQGGIKFLREFTIKAAKNYNANSGKGFFGLFSKKKCSPKYGFYGLNLFWKEVQDREGRIAKSFVNMTISSIGNIFQNQEFFGERNDYMSSCIKFIERKESFGQCVRILKQLVNSYPTSTFISDNRESIIAKLDQKYQLLDILIRSLKSLKGVEEKKLKIPFDQSLKYFYQFLEDYEEFLRYPLRLEHIQYLWRYPHIFDYLRKTKEIDTGGQISMPEWKKKFYKKISPELMKEILSKLVIHDNYFYLTPQFFNAIDQLFLSYHYSTKNLQITQKSTIRYKTIQGLVGLDFYFRFIEKILVSPEKKNLQLFKKVIIRIIELYLRPVSYENIEEKCKNWLKCLISIVKLLKNDPLKCMYAVQYFLQEIKGRMFKDILATGNMDIVVMFQGLQKTVNIARNATIYRFRKSLMSAFSLKCNFAIFNYEMKRQVSFVEEEDFSVNAMSYKFKGPSIQIRRVEQAHEHPQMRAVNRFMEILQNENEFYQIIFGLLPQVKQMEDQKDMQHRIWKLIENLPTNKGIIEKIQKCQKYSKQNWQEFLQVDTLDHLQYSLKIILQLMANAEWTFDLLKTGGLETLEDLYLKELEISWPKIHDKTINQLTKIHLKALDILKAEDITKGKNKQSIVAAIKILISNIFDEKTEKKVQSHQIETINLVLKYLLTSWKKTGFPSRDNLIEYFQTNNLLIKIAEFGLFISKQVDAYFTEYILETIVLKVYQLKQKSQFFMELIKKYLSLPFLSSCPSTENYFTFIIDFLNSLTPEEELQVVPVPIEKLIQEFINSVIFNQIETYENILTLDSELVYGTFKLMATMIRMNEEDVGEEKVPKERSDKQVMIKLLDKFIFHETKNQSLTKKSFKQKNKKILYDIIKKMIYSEETLLDIFVERIEDSLATGNWRKNTYYSWSLEQPKNGKKYFCGLENLAATCYINCLFQQLFMINRFRDRFIDVNSLAYRETFQNNEIYQLQKILAFLKYGKKKSYTTRPFCQSFITYEGVPIDPTIQSDADQFFNTLMQKVETFLKATGKHYILQDTFQGKLSNQLNCEDCPHNSEKIENFLSIGLQIKNKRTLEEALNGYVEGEILDGDNAYFCEICEKKVRTMKRLCIKELPNILVIVLKRFSYNFDEERKIKINDQLKYPKEINMKQYTSSYLQKQETLPDEEYQYRLRGAVIHSGTSEGGHYYSFIKEQQKWFEFNDESIEQTDYRRIQEEGFGGDEKDSQFKLEKHRNAYILFYQKNKQHFSSQNQEEVQLKQEQEPFEKELMQIVQTDNRNSDFLAVILDHLFVRLCENISMCGHVKAKKFILLYFHTVLLRDKHHDDYLTNIYRVILSLLENVEFADWFLGEVNHHYVKEFLIEAPKMIRYLCTGLVLQAIKIVGPPKVEGLLPCFLLFLKKKGMSPFAKIFTQLSSYPSVKEKMDLYEYPTKILNILLSRNIPTESIIYDPKQSYFGKDSSIKEKQMEFCHSALLESLKNFSITNEDAFALLEQYTSRTCYRTLSKMIAKNIKKFEQAEKILLGMEDKVLSEKCKRQNVDQYLMIIRYFFTCAEKHPEFSQQLKQMCLMSLRTVIKDNDSNYMIMELTIVQLNKIGNRNEQFKKRWREKVAKDDRLKKSLNYWVRQSDRPHFMSKSEEWKRKIINLSYSQKQVLTTSNKITQQKRTNWMHNEQAECLEIYSEIDECQLGKEAVVGFRSVIVREHLGLLTKVDVEKQNKWAVLERNEIDIYSWL